eukprot:TRINITY_DN14533_c0_g1_i1.p1 TRINITY_DN14533_c0_g1~~TRINITY_DN14533_c0_g1_i1.p1  ORF type:complete len:557 (+),score=165.23 TRINITY_DN14533_c0_g1_i1:79-1749(+)
MTGSEGSSKKKKKEDKTKKREERKKKRREREIEQQKSPKIKGIPASLRKSQKRLRKLNHSSPTNTIHSTRSFNNNLSPRKIVQRKKQNRIKVANSTPNINIPNGRVEKKSIVHIQTTQVREDTQEKNNKFFKYEEKAIVLKDYNPTDEDELYLAKDEIIIVVERHESGWYAGYKQNLDESTPALSVFELKFFPGSYVQLLSENYNSPLPDISEIISVQKEQTNQFINISNVSDESKRLLFNMKKSAKSFDLKKSVPHELRESRILSNLDESIENLEDILENALNILSEEDREFISIISHDEISEQLKKIEKLFILNSEHNKVLNNKFKKLDSDISVLKSDINSKEQQYPKIDTLLKLQRELQNLQNSQNHLLERCSKMKRGEEKFKTEIAMDRKKFRKLKQALDNIITEYLEKELICIELKSKLEELIMFESYNINDIIDEEVTQYLSYEDNIDDLQYQYAIYEHALYLYENRNNPSVVSVEQTKENENLLELQDYKNSLENQLYEQQTQHQKEKNDIQENIYKIEQKQVLLQKLVEEKLDAQLEKLESILDIKKP